MNRWWLSDWWEEKLKLPAWVPPASWFENSTKDPLCMLVMDVFDAVTLWRAALQHLKSCDLRSERWWMVERSALGCFVSKKEAGQELVGQIVQIVPSTLWMISLQPFLNTTLLNGRGEPDWLFASKWLTVGHTHFNLHDITRCSFSLLVNFNSLRTEKALVFENCEHVVVIFNIY